MIRIYTSPSCSSCRKVKKWFEDNKIPYEAKNIFAANLTAEELKDVISKTENGTDDIISLRSKVVQENNIDFDEMTISQLVEFIRANPSVLKRPIIVDDHRIQVGYNEEEIRTFALVAQPGTKKRNKKIALPNRKSFSFIPQGPLRRA